MGGAEYQARLLVDHLVRHYDVDVVYLTARTDPAHLPDGYRMMQFSNDTGIRRYGSFFDAIRLYRVLRALAPDVIYQQVGCAHTGIAAFYARRHGCRMVWRVASDRTVTPLQGPFWRRPHHWVERRFLEYGIRHADAIYAQNALQQRLLRERYDRESVLVRNFHPAPSDERRDGVGGRRTVIWIGNLKPLKNPAAFLRLAQSFAARTDLEFVMIGARIDDTQWTKDVLAAIAACSNVRYLGSLPQREVHEQLRRSSVLVSTSDYEGFPNTFIEAWLRGVPVVSLHADPDELLSQGGYGYVSGSERALREHVMQLVDAPERAAQIGETARAYALRAHSMGNADQIARLLGLAPLARGAAAPKGAAGHAPERASSGLAVGAG
jgi:glycosyltransferase involved in cell wall biosynthesis